MLTLGIDDAGRGPLIGPMILAGCLMDKKTESELKKLGVKDSKQLTQKRREFLSKIIKEKSETFEIIIISSSEIDKKNAEGTKLNELEAMACAKIIDRINKGFNKIKVIIDCPSTSIVKWQDFLKTKIKNLSNLEISCEHKADSNHVSVASASVLAKTTRELEIEKIKKKLGKDFGSGYTSDPKTIKFMGNHYQKHKKDGIFRETWSTLKNFKLKKGQKKLSEF